ncbi:class I SAM-dependent methyltransferase [Cnuibacter sp. UC19_7]|uniref:class I SAM-dependent methyltransferase n=1 Tax=Cnuibacter sp. UC19_7 TaxID=3350166 RepID=UPI00366AE30A
MSEAAGSASAASGDDAAAAASGEAWSPIAEEWAARWGRVADPARDEIVRRAGIGPGSRVLDVGCGSGEFAAQLVAAGAVVAAVDAAPGMVALARWAAPAAEVRLAPIDRLPFGDGVFDVVVAVNALQFADDMAAALAELARVTAPGGAVVVANWAERARNDLDTLETAVAIDDGDDPDDLVDLGYRLPGGLDALFAEVGIPVEWSSTVDVPWRAATDDDLARGVLLGEDDDTIAARAPVVVAAARPFAAPDGGYELRNAFYVVVGRIPR